MKIRYSNLLIAAVALIVTTVASMSAAEFIDPYKDYDESKALDMEIEENLATPPVQLADKEPVKRYMKALAQRLSSKYKVELMRNGEVIVITIPTDRLFLPNDTLLSKEAPGQLRPLLPLFNTPDMFKLVYAVHTDDTGSESYTDELSSARSQSIYAWLMDEGHINPELFIINYDMGATRPMYSNDTRVNRAQNRRLELFLVPGPKLITMAHQGKIK